MENHSELLHNPNTKSSIFASIEQGAFVKCWFCATYSSAQNRWM
jgi:hypothetical protein